MRTPPSRESTFALLELHDLSRALAVNHSAAGLRRMQTTSASIDCDESEFAVKGGIPRSFPPLRSPVASPLIPHLVAIEIRDALLLSNEAARLILPVKLVSLQLDLLVE